MRKIMKCSVDFSKAESLILLQTMKQKLHQKFYDCTVPDNKLLREYRVLPLNKNS